MIGSYAENQFPPTIGHDRGGNQNSLPSVIGLFKIGALIEISLQTLDVTVARYFVQGIGRSRNQAEI